MHFTAPLVVLLSSGGLIDAIATGFHHAHHKRAMIDASRVIKRADSTCLDKTALQTGSEFTGQETGTDGIKPGQAPSETDNANFINFCAGQTLTNGKQLNTGSCNGIPMGKIPAAENMVAAIITNPQPGDIIQSDTTFNISVQTQKLTAGHFTNPTVAYYSAPQDLDANGQIVGHCHVTVQTLGTSLKSFTPPDPNTFAFFKGIDDAGNGKGLLQAVVTGGLPAGFYRVCTLMSSQNHQPVLLPIAQRGSPDDCTKFQVVDSGKKASTSSAAATKTTKTAIASSLFSVTKATAQPTGQGGSSEVIKIKSGTLGGEAPFVVSSGDSSRPFSVNGNTFVNAAAAVQRSCDIQFNACADAFNRGSLQGKTIADCDQQKNSCGAA